MNSIDMVKRVHRYSEEKIRLYFYRKQAHRLIKQLVNRRGYKIVDKKKMRMLKSYAKKTFGSSSFWPWLSLYTEIRGEFKTGWIPNDYFLACLSRQYNPESIRISAYKTFDHKVFPNFAPDPLLLKIGKNIYDSDRRPIAINKAENILADYNDEVVLKEDEGFGGHGVKFIESGKLDLDTYSHISSYIIQPVIQQHEDLGLLNDKTVNTVRVLTYLNDEGEIDIKYAYLRFGIGESRVDNASSGGGFCFVKSNGHLAEGAYNRFGIKIGERHPDSGITFKSIAIPSYEKVLDQCIKSHKIFPYLRFIGWDVTVNKLGDPVLLEWNSAPLIWLPEALNGPFFEEQL
ncbi:sugar-transfer associated ATP-grasp domain-containing protein [Fodinibius sediminis]|uniref:Sugar-transfer associated ATP-grasp n=1 Tax=Fodinibius sediminis TaxID=1214077 RepID=A0A521B2Y2_9BACT|nr:sugar-transfer associated ATP-grasp domain-containing protein [Fodinibius sediminis]SMO41467.1 Sugar-transfer associated ATP-grasp [Fodinibius sediminis]